MEITYVAAGALCLAVAGTVMRAVSQRRHAGLARIAEGQTSSVFMAISIVLLAVFGGAFLLKGLLG